MQIIDYFSDFKDYYKKDASIEELLQLWLDYTKNKLDIQEKCINDYQDNGYDYKEMAYQHVFHLTHQNYEKMELAYKRLKDILSKVLRNIEENMHLDLDINIVLYHGLGNGAGWAGKYHGKYAVLFGIEKIAELDWHEIPKLEALVSHEITHLIHFSIRGFDDFNKERNLYQQGLWQLYIEGVAQFYQSVILGKKVESREPSWESACLNNFQELKSIFLKQLNDEVKGCNEFFGDWYQVLGISDAGYYLGQRFIEMLNKQYTLHEIALLDEKELESKIIQFLTK